MRAVAFTIMCFIYLISVSAWVVDEALLKDTQFRPLAMDGSRLDAAALINSEDNAFRSLANQTLNPSDGDQNIIDRIGQSLEASYASVWVILDLLAGTYAFNILYAVGIDPVLVTMLKLIMPMLIAMQVIWFVAGRY